MRCGACASPVELDVAFCGVCGAAVGPTCPRCARTCRTGEHFCALCGAQLDAGQVDGEAPAELRRAERKLVTIVFIDMVGFTSLGHQFDPEIVREAMTSFFRALAATVRAHGGYVEKFIGDAMMSVFGAPISREDDAERALSSAIEMHRRLDEVNAIWAARLGRQIQIRIGVNTGIAVAGPIGEGRATDYGVCGDVVNTASRLQSAADPGQTIIGEGTRELGGRAFLYASIPPLTLKGKPEPVPAFRLLGRAEAVTELFALAPHVGRDAEVGQIFDVLGLVRAGGTAAVAVVGQTGSGKTRLLRALREEPGSGGVRWVDPTSDDAPLSLVRSIARELAGDAAPTEVARRALGLTDALTVDLVAWLLGVDPPADSIVAGLDGPRRAELLGGVLARLVRGAGQPVVLALDDVEGADGASLAVLAAALAAASTDGDGGPGWLLVASSPPTWIAPWEVATTVELNELTPSALRTLLIASMGDEEVEAAAVEALVAAAHGNPLALTELAWSYRATGEVPKPRAGGVSGTILALVQSRIDAVDEDAKHILQVGAVIGSSFPLPIVEDVVGAGIDVAGAVARLRRRGLVVGAGDEPRFAQTAIRDVAYDGLLLGERRRLHSAVAAAYVAAGVDDPFLLAQHHGRGDDDAAAVAALTRAGDAHLALGSPADGARCFERALERLGDAAQGDVTRSYILGRLADVDALQGRLDSASERLVGAIMALDVGLDRAELYRRQAIVEHRRGDDDAALDALQMARDDVTMTELEGAASVEAIFATLAGLAAAAARIQLARGQAEDAGWEARLALEMLAHLGPEQVEAAAARQSLAEAHLVLAESLLADSDAEQASEHGDAARVAFAARHDVAGMLRADIAIARARVLSGAAAEARARAETAHELARRLGDREAIALCEALLAEAAETVA